MGGLAERRSRAGTFGAEVIGVGTGITPLVLSPGSKSANRIDPAGTKYTIFEIKGASFPKRRPRNEMMKFSFWLF